ncbi:MAG: TSCPD domain-containing protein [Candidatus Bathyanammoxibius sp.]
MTGDGVLAKPSRPKLIGGITVCTVTGCGKMYVQLNWLGGRLFEIFATLGKGGGCAICQSEALTRSITVGLKCGVPVDEYVRQVRGIRCPSPLMFPKDEQALSCPDALSHVLEEYGSLSIDNVVKLLLGMNGASSNGDEIIVGVGAGDPDLTEDEAAVEIERLRTVRDAAGLSGY